MTFHDARRLNVGSIAADICIVGAGAAGITLARELAGRSQRVALLESGDFRFQHRPQLLYLGANTGMPNFSTAKSRFRRFGGSTTRWGGQCRPLDPLDFEVRDGVEHSGWPMRRDELEPWYRRGQRACNLGPYDYLPATWQQHDASGLHVANERLDTKIYQFSYPSDFGEVYRAELAAAANVDVYLNANVIDIEADEYANSVKSVRVATFNGRSVRVVARTFVLACGGIENARLLLASNRNGGPGIGNAHDLVGRYFMDHPYFLVGHYVPSEPRYANSTYVIEDYARVGSEQKANAGFTLHENLLRAERLNGGAVYFVPRPIYKSLPEYFSPGGQSFIHLVDVLSHSELPDRRFGRHLLNVIGGYRDVGRTLARWAANLARPQRVIALRAVIEATPNRESRVRLGHRRDHFGMPRVEVDWRLNSADQRGLRRLLSVMGDEFTRLGLGTLVLDPAVHAEGWHSSMTGGKHHMGTTRMHADPRRGVVDANCRVHGFANLYVAGSSVFPTAGYANPTLTIVALALRLADHLGSRD
jgi:choline dehydrogenase-like flavoprotein